MTAFRDRAIEIYDAFTHEHRDRRTLLKQMTALAGSVAAAETLILGIAASPAAAAQQVSETDARLATNTVRSTAAGKPSIAYVATLRANASHPVPVVLVIHENRGLNAHIRDVARRLALAGFWVIAPDLLAPQGGTPDDEDRARALIGTVDYDLAIAQLRDIRADLSGDDDANGKVGAVGFCWGGGFVNRLAIAEGQALDAAVAYYGPAPDPAEATKVWTPMLLHYAGKDARVAATGVPWTEALKAAGKTVEAYTYPGVDHAFNNDTSAERYNKPAADLAWGRTIAFFHKYLDA